MDSTRRLLIHHYDSEFEGDVDRLEGLVALVLAAMGRLESNAARNGLRCVVDLFRWECHAYLPRGVMNSTLCRHGMLFCEQVLPSLWNKTTRQTQNVLTDRLNTDILSADIHTYNTHHGAQNKQPVHELTTNGCGCSSGASCRLHTPLVRL